MNRTNWILGLALALAATVWAILTFAGDRGAPPSSDEVSSGVAQQSGNETGDGSGSDALDGNPSPIRTGGPLLDPRRTETPTREDASNAPDRGLVGRILDPEGRPLGGATVRLFERDPRMLVERTAQGGAWPAEAEVLSEDDGRFVFPIGRSGMHRFQVLARHPEHAIARGFADLGPDQGLVDLGDLRLNPGLRISGLVVVKTQRVPVRDARISIETATLQSGDPAAPEPICRTASSYDGRFELGPVAPGKVSLRVEADGHVGVLRALDLRFNRPLEPIVIELDAGRRTTGRVLDSETGMPIRNAEVEARSLGTGLFEHTYSDEHGLFELDELAAGETGFRVRAEGFAVLDSETYPTPPADLVLRPKRLPPISIEVRGPTGELVFGYEVRPRRVVGEPMERLAKIPGARAAIVRREDVDDLGRYEIGTLPPGPSVLEVRLDDFALGTSLIFDPADPTTGMPIEVRLERGARLRGRVVSARGAALVGARVLVRPAQGESRPFDWAEELVSEHGSRRDLRTGEEGWFQADHLLAGNYRLEVLDRDHATLRRARITIRPGEALELGDLALQAGCRIEGRLLFDGVPAVRGVVRVCSASETGAESGRIIAETRTDASGRFILPRRLAAGDYRLSAAHESDSALRILLDHRLSDRPVTVPSGFATAEWNVDIQTLR